MLLTGRGAKTWIALFCVALTVACSVAYLHSLSSEREAPGQGGSYRLLSIEETISLAKIGNPGPKVLVQYLRANPRARPEIHRLMRDVSFKAHWSALSRFFRQIGTDTDVGRLREYITAPRDKAIFHDIIAIQGVGDSLSRMSWRGEEKALRLLSEACSIEFWKQNTFVISDDTESSYPYEVFMAVEYLDNLRESENVEAYRQREQEFLESLQDHYPQHYEPIAAYFQSVSSNATTSVP